MYMSRQRVLITQCIIFETCLYSFTLHIRKTLPLPIYSTNSTLVFSGDRPLREVKNNVTNAIHSLLEKRF